MRRRAAKKGYPSTLSLAEYLELIGMDCFYCGQKPTLRRSKRTDPYIPHQGLDRIDSTLGYDRSNIVPCCYTCNVMKQTLTPSSFYDHLTRIIRNLMKLPKV